MFFTLRKTIIITVSSLSIIAISFFTFHLFPFTPLVSCSGTGYIKTDPINATLNESTTLYIFGKVQYPGGNNPLVIRVFGPERFNTYYDFTPDLSTGKFQQPFTLDHSTLDGLYNVTGTYCNNILTGTSFRVLNLIDKHPPPGINYTTNEIKITSISTKDSPMSAYSSNLQRGKLSYIDLSLYSRVDRSVVISIQVLSGNLTIAQNWFKTQISRPGSDIMTAVQIPHDPQITKVKIFATVYSDWPVSNSDNVLARIVSNPVEVKSKINY